MEHCRSQGHQKGIVGSDALEFYDDQQTRTREIYNEFDPEQENLNESMVSI